TRRTRTDLQGTSCTLHVPDFPGQSRMEVFMRQAFVKTVIAAGFATLLGGCATTVDWGGPLLHYRYQYDSRPIVERSVPAVVYDEPAVTYREPGVLYREPRVVYREPVVVYDDGSSIAAHDHGQ